MHLLARKGAKLGLGTNDTADTCFRSVLVCSPAMLAYRTESHGVFPNDGRYHDRCNLRPVFSVLFFSHADFS